MSPKKNRDFSKGPVFDPTKQRYLVDISYPDGSRKRKRFTRERQAGRFWAAEQAKIENGTWDELAPRSIKLGPSLDEYREYCKTHHRSFRTYMERPLNFWEEEFGRETPLVKISRVRIEKVKLKLAREMSRSTVNRYLSVLKTAFNWFVLQGMFNVNRVRKIKFFRTNNEIVRYLDSVTEYPKLLDEATKIRWYLPHMIKLGVHTGLRKRNLLHLRWDQCDFKTRTIRIATETKNEEVIALPMNDTVLQTLREVKEITGHMNYVFSHLKGKDKGKPINDVKTAFHSACERAGIQDFRWHDLRHTFASWLVMKRVSLLAVQKLLGHKSMRMTLRYAHLAPDYLADEVRVLDDN